MSPTAVETVRHFYARPGVPIIGLTPFLGLQAAISGFQIKRKLFVLGCLFVFVSF
jgi:hypothetical protein